MDIRISTSSGVPIYLQIVDQVKAMVATGKLSSGQELPSIRELAEKHGVTPNTVVRAYRELEVAGIVVKRSTAGTFIAEDASLAARERQRTLEEAADRFLLETGKMGATLEEGIAEIRKRARKSRSTAEE